MNIKPEEITAILEKEIESLDWKVNVKEVGYVLQVGDGIARVYGLENVMAGEMVKFSITQILKVIMIKTLQKTFLLRMVFLKYNL